MDLTTVYCNLEDFYRNFNVEAPHDLLLGPRHLRQRCTSLSPSELMTILVMFHQSRGYRNFKGYLQGAGPEALASRVPRCPQLHSCGPASSSGPLALGSLPGKSPW